MIVRLCGRLVAEGVCRKEEKAAIISAIMVTMKKRLWRKNGGAEQEGRETGDARWSLYYCFKLALAYFVEVKFDDRSTRQQ